MKKILLVDDEKHILEDLGEFLRRKNYLVYTSMSVDDAKSILSKEKIDYAIIDLRLDDTSECSGIRIVNFAKRKRPQIKTTILSAYAFEQMKNELKKELREQLEPERILQEIKKNYISKGDETNYIRAVLDKMDEFMRGDNPSNKG